MEATKGDGASPYEVYKPTKVSNPTPPPPDFDIKDYLKKLPVKKASVKEDIDVEEANEPKPPHEVLNKISRAYGRKHRGVNVDTSHINKTGDIRVNQLWVPPDQQGKGIGTRIMKGLGKYADKTGKRITLNQDPDPGKKAKLAKFYKSHGFVANKGRNKDFTTRDTYIRNPKTDQN